MIIEVCSPMPLSLTVLPGMLITIPSEWLGNVKGASHGICNNFNWMQRKQFISKKGGKKAREKHHNTKYELRERRRRGGGGVKTYNHMINGLSFLLYFSRGTKLRQIVISWGMPIGKVQSWASYKLLAFQSINTNTYT